MQYESKKYDALIGLSGFSEQLLTNHFTLYQGYVSNFNKLNDELVKIEEENKFQTPEYAELNRRFGWEFNGMRLHEYYFENLSRQPESLPPDSKITETITNEFGSFEMFEKDFRSLAAMRGIGWVILYFDQLAGRLFNVWINEHDTGHLAGAVPLLVMDIFEHAYMIDYGIKRADYIDAFFKAIDWATVTDRFKHACFIK